MRKDKASIAPPNATNASKAAISVGAPSKDGLLTAAELHRTTRRGSKKPFATNKSAAAAGDEYNPPSTAASQAPKLAAAERRAMLARKCEDADHCSELLAKRLQSVECRQAGITQERLEERCAEQAAGVERDEELARSLQAGVEEEEQDEARRETEALIAQELRQQEEQDADLARALQEELSAVGLSAKPFDTALLFAGGAGMGQNAVTDADAVADAVDADLLLALSLSAEEFERSSLPLGVTGEAEGKEG